MLRFTHTTRACRALIASAAIVGLVAAPVLVSPAPVGAVAPGYNGKIAYQTDVDGNFEIYLMNADGTGQVNLTNHAANEKAPSWSPDGNRVAFFSDRDGNEEVYVMNADGTGQTRLTNDPASDAYPDWSPDGTMIVFRSDRNGNHDIFVINADGSGLTQLTSSPATETAPRWSSLGAQIAYRRVENPYQDVYVMNADGTGQTKVTNDPGAGVTIANNSWSPDDRYIAYVSNETGDDEIWAIKPDGSDPQNLTNRAGSSESNPSWSPDGTSLVYKSDQPGNFEIYVMNADGTGQTQITTIGAVSGEPVWQPVPNLVPNAADDALAVLFNTSGEKAVLANDTDEEALSGANLTITVQPSHGSASVEASTGKISYTPTDGYIGADSLTYQICDSFTLDQRCSTAVLGITVQAGPVPAKPTITSVGTVTMNGASTVYYTGHRPTFSGTSVANAAIRVEINSDPIVLTTTADAEGNWSVTPDQDIPDGEHTVTITAAKDGAMSEALSFTLGINTGLAATGWPLWPLSVVGLLTVVAARGWLSRRHGAA